MDNRKIEFVIVKGIPFSGKSDFVAHHFSENPKYLILDPRYFRTIQENHGALFCLDDDLINEMVFQIAALFVRELESDNQMNFVLEIPDVHGYEKLEKQLTQLLCHHGVFVRKVQIHSDEDKSLYLEEMAASDPAYISSETFTAELLQELIAYLENKYLEEAQVHSAIKEVIKTQTQA